MPPEQGRASPLRRGPYLKGRHAHQGRTPTSGSPGQGLAPPRLALSTPLFLPAQVGSLGRAIHLQLCSVSIPRAKEHALRAITLLARDHAPQLAAAFLDFSIPLDRCPASPRLAAPCLPSVLPQAGAWPAPPDPALLPVRFLPMGTPAGLGVGREPTNLLTPGVSPGRHCSPFILLVFHVKRACPASGSHHPMERGPGPWWSENAPARTRASPRSPSTAPFLLLPPSVHLSPLGWGWLFPTARRPESRGGLETSFSLKSQLQIQALCTTCHPFTTLLP